MPSRSTKEALALAPADDHVRAGARPVGAGEGTCADGKARAGRTARAGGRRDRRSSDLLNDKAESLLALAEVLGLRGKTTEAAEALEQARALFEAKGNVVAADRTRASLLALAG